MISLKILNFFDLKITLFSKIISSSVKKFPLFAVTDIFCLSQFIENFGFQLIIQGNGKRIKQLTKAGTKLKKGQTVKINLS